MRILVRDSEGGGMISVWLFQFLRSTRRRYDAELGGWWSFS